MEKKAEPTEEQKSAMSYLRSAVMGGAKSSEPELTEPEEKPAGSMMEALGLATKEEPETEEPPPTISETLHARRVPACAVQSVTRARPEGLARASPRHPTSPSRSLRRA